MEIIGLSIEQLTILVVASAATLGIGYAIYVLGTMTARTCRKIRYPIQRTLDEGANVPDSYQTARQDFLDAAIDAGGRVQSIPCPEKGAAGETLFMDVALFGKENAPSVLVVSSGTHGVEGFAGSGIQTRLLKEGIVQKLPSSVKLLMIHAINPYGMAHLRRFNEDNVDLNRNFIDHSLTQEPNTGYAELAGVIAPDSLSFWSEVRSWSKLLWFRWSQGSKKAQTAIEGGQYEYPKGLFYGGTSESWSNRTIRSVARQYLIAADEAVWVDIHTGLGKYGAAEIIIESDSESREFNRALAIWGPELPKATQTGDSVAPRLHGSIKAALSEECPRVRMTAVTLEFGTLPMMDVFLALRAENWLHHHGGSDRAQAWEIKQSLLRAFHPGTKEWEDTVWEHGKDIIAKDLLYLVKANRN